MATYQGISRAAEQTEQVAEQPPLLSETYIPQVLPRTLTSWDMTITFVVSTYLATCATTAAAGGPAAFTHLAVGAITFLIPCLIATMQLGVLFPYAGALYNWTHRAMGGYWSFFSGFCAWFPGVLISSSLASLLVTYIQSMHDGWLVEPWQQGLAICIILIFGGIISVQRFRMVQHLLNLLACCMLIGTLFILLAGLIWLLSGHGSATDLGNWGEWRIRPENYVLFGLTVFAYIGADVPLNLAGEIRENHTQVIKRHLLWGPIILCCMYVTNTLAVLIVLGPEAAGDPFAMVTLVDMVLGKTVGNIVAICMMCSFLTTILAYNYLFARLLLVACVDRRLPIAVGKLNENRAPSNAVIFQTTLAVGFVIVAFVVAPLVTIFGNPVDLSVQVYIVSQAAATLVWAISTMFLFIDLIGCYMRDRKNFMSKKIFPLPVLFLSAGVGTFSCIVGIVGTLRYSWITQISDSQWWYVVGGLTICFLLVAAIGGMFANSEAAWQQDNVLT